MVKIYYESDVDSTLFNDNGIYRFSFKIDDINPLYINDIIYDVQRVVFESGGRGIKTRKSKGKLNFGFTADNGGIAEDGFKHSVELLKQWKIGQPAQKIATTPQTNYPFKVGDEFIFSNTLNYDIRELKAYKILSVQDKYIQYEGYDSNGVQQIKTLPNLQEFIDSVSIGDAIILPEVKYMIQNKGLLYIDYDLYKCNISLGGDLDFSYHKSKDQVEHYTTNVKSLTPKLISFLIEKSYWQPLTINVGDRFKFKNKLTPFSADEITIMSMDANGVIEYAEEKVGLLPDFTTSHIINVEDALWKSNAYKIVDAKAISDNYQKSQGLNELEKRLMELKDENKNLVQLREAINDVDFEDKFNVNNMIKANQKELDKINGQLLEAKIGSDTFFDALFDQSFKPLLNRYDSKLTKNVEQTLLSPNGQMSDLPQELQSIINSQDFIEWFGDWKTAYMYRNLPDFGGENVSKAVSDKFEPLLVWHGTGKAFSYFKFDKFPANYFAVNKQYSDFFAGIQSEDGIGYVLPFFINVKNPLDLTLFANDSVEPQEFWDWIYLQTGMTAEELEVVPIFSDRTMKPIPVWVYIRNNPKMLVNIAQKTNFDGIVFDEFNPNIKDTNSPAYSTRAYIVFDPHQVKLADPERGGILLSDLKSFMLKRGGKI
jgi:hypothetical protein